MSYSGKSAANQLGTDRERIDSDSERNGDTGRTWLRLGLDLKFLPPLGQCRNGLDPSIAIALNGRESQS